MKLNCKMYGCSSMSFVFLMKPVVSTSKTKILMVVEQGSKEEDTKTPLDNFLKALSANDERGEGGGGGGGVLVVSTYLNKSEFNFRSLGVLVIFVLFDIGYFMWLLVYGWFCGSLF